MSRSKLSYKIKIPAGIDDGQSIRLEGKGEHAGSGSVAGDLYIRAHVKEDERFERDGYDIYTEVNISYPQAVFGDTIEIDTVDGEKKLVIPAGTQSHQNIRLKGRGVPQVNGSGRGDQFVKVIVDVPKKVSRNAKKLLEELKEEIRFKIIEPLKNPELFEYYGKGMGGGILLYGPPGCGKSLIAKATANEAKANFIHVKSSDLKSKYVGETEKNIAELFEKARNSQPTIIFFDEFEVLGADRSNSHSHERSAVAQLLTEMDGVDAKEQQILLLAATNEPWAIDPALRREGRFGSTIFVPLPDLEARETIIRTNMIYRPTAEINFLEIAHSTPGLSGADIKGICEMATDIPLKESIQTGQRRKISKTDFSLAVKKNNSVIKQWFTKAIEQLKQKKMEEVFGDLLIHAQKIEGIGC